MISRKPQAAPSQSSSTNTGDLLPDVVERIVRCFAPVWIILFGSRAHGTGCPDSNLDLLVVLPKVPDRHAAAVGVMRELADLPVGKDIIVSTREHLSTAFSLADRWCRSRPPEQLQSGPVSIHVSLTVNRYTDSMHGTTVPRELDRHIG